MGSKRCRLYDENLVHNIMLSTGLSVMEFMKENTRAESEEICDFVEANADIIIGDTIRHLKNMNDLHEKNGEGTKGGDDSGEWTTGDVDTQ